MNDEIQAFATSTGEVVCAWAIVLSEPELRSESKPCTYHEADGSIREGSISYSLEIREVRFLSDTGSVCPGVLGQLSVHGDQFYDVTVMSVEARGPHDLVIGEASKKADWS